ncbi:hypothetical protein T4D_16489 [Trichinella pseudospiralis]|uniref:Uncharacterized protein n=1 Tax=Trichinella pseudospiralis TaxID=6337 RepID=A0A0V1DQR2_TRIPS|nr:hypothetical protein T4D_16489 [Trichinella pseudospiralis]
MALNFILNVSKSKITRRSVFSSITRRNPPFSGQTHQLNYRLINFLCQRPRLVCLNYNEKHAEACFD